MEFGHGLADPHMMRDIQAISPHETFFLERRKGPIEVVVFNNDRETSDGGCGFEASQGEPCQCGWKYHGHAVFPKSIGVEEADHGRVGIGQVSLGVQFHEGIRTFFWHRREVLMRFVLPEFLAEITKNNQRT